MITQSWFCPRTLAHQQWEKILNNVLDFYVSVTWTQIRDLDFSEEELDDIYAAVDTAIHNSGIDEYATLKRVDRNMNVAQPVR